MKVFFIGSVVFSREMLETMLGFSKVDIVGIATKSSSSFNSDHSDLSDLAVKYNIPYKYVRDINAPQIIDWIESLRSDVIFCLGWSSLIKENILNIPKKGVIGYHPAELPHNKGRHPQIWAMVLGLEKTASTFFLMDQGADTGEIISQSEIKIEFEDNAKSVYDKLIKTAKVQLLELLIKLNNDSLIKISQDKNAGNHWRKRSKEDGRIDWRMRTIDIYNLVRALSFPFPGAHFDYQGNEVKVWECRPYEQDVPKNYEPGKILGNENGEIIVKTGDGAIVLLNLELHALDQKESYLI
jgi:methionyl-tRNA formyltransferase